MADTRSSSVAQASYEERQYSTFYLAGRLYGIDVLQVQEITRALSMSRVPRAPKYVHGIINLRGQISTAIGLRDLFEIEPEPIEHPMNVVCNLEGTLLSFVVDRVGDVITTQSKDFEVVPDTLQPNIKKFLSGVYKLPSDILSVIDIQIIWNSMNS